MLDVKNNKSISIICATYNAEKYLNKFLKSIESQTVKDFELIIVDGGSSDKTIDIIRANRSLVSKYISEFDNGIYDAWNKGIKLASCDWIAFVGADDVLFTDYISTYISSIRNCPPNTDYISSKVNYVNNNFEILKVLGRNWKWNEFKYRMTSAHVGSLHSKRLFKDVGYFNIKYKIVGDYELLLRKKEKLNTFFIDKITVNMLAGGISLSNSALIERRRAQLLTAKIHPIKANLVLIYGFLSLIVKVLAK